ncbi:MAG: efflux RND transporter periplasmic adaptor subunit [bacterium]
MAKGYVLINKQERKLYKIKIISPTEIVVSRKITLAGKLTYAAPLVKNISLKYSGYIEKLYANRPGQAINVSQPIIEIYSPTVLDAENDFILAYENYLKIDGTEFKIGHFNYSKRIAKSFYSAAKTRLALMGISSRRINSLKNNLAAKTNIIIKSPAGGVLVKKFINSGSHFNVGQKLLTIANLNKLWMTVEIPEKLTVYIHKGQYLSAYFDDIRTKYKGIVLSMYPFVSAKEDATKTIIVFNHHSLLKPNMYGKIIIKTPPVKTLAVPAKSVLIINKTAYILVNGGNGYFIPQKISIGKKYHKYYSVIKGLKKGEKFINSLKFLTYFKS